MKMREFAGISLIFGPPQGPGAFAVREMVEKSPPMMYNNIYLCTMNAGGVNMKTIVSTPKAPAAIGPYSQAVRSGGMIYTSGMIPVDPATGQIVAGGVEAQARQALMNLKALIEASGSTMDRVVKTTVFIKDMNDFGRINEVYAGFFPEGAYPSRSCVEVARLPQDVLLELEAVAEAQV